MMILIELYLLVILLNIIIISVISYKSYYLTLQSYRYHSNSILYNSNDKNKKIEIALKIKRLKQIKEDGKGYQEYINEQKKYDIINKMKVDDDNVIQSINMTCKIKQMEKVILYINKQNNNSMNDVEENSRMILKNQSIAFLPDVGYNEKCRFFYKHLFTKGLANNSTINFIDMPDITELNTKRYEQQWMNYMRNLNLSNYDIVIGHGTSGDALIRYLESETIKFAVFIDAADIYTAGERHGRSYLYTRIRGHCKNFRIIALSRRGANDALTIRNELDPNIYNLDPVIEDYDFINTNELTEKVINIITKAITL